jgi:hypothetical protein
MVSGILIGILKEQHADYIVLGDNIRRLLPAGLTLDRIESGALVSIDYIRDGGGEMVVQGMKLGRGFRPYD